MALISGITRTQSTIAPPIAAIVSPLLTTPVAPVKASTTATGPGVSYTPSLPLPTATTAPAAATTPAPAPSAAAVTYAPSLPLPTTATPAASTAPASAAPAAAASAAPSTPEVSYAPSLIGPATIIPIAVPDAVAATVAPTPFASVAAPVLPLLSPATPSPSQPTDEPSTPAPTQTDSAPTPVSAAPATDLTLTESRSSTPPAAAKQPSLLDLYYSATQPTSAQALAGFVMPIPTIAPTLTPLVRTGAEIIADAAYTLVAGAQNDTGGIGMLLDSTGAQKSEESNRRTPDAKKSSALAA